MTTAMKLKEEGKIESKIESARKMLEHDISVTLIGLPPGIEIILYFLPLLIVQEKAGVLYLFFSVLSFFLYKTLMKRKKRLKPRTTD